KMQDISQGEGRTVLFVSHNMAAVKSLCTRAIVLEHGKTVFEGGTDESVEYYLAKNSDRIINKRYFAVDENATVQEISITNNIITSGENLTIDFKLQQKPLGKTNIHLGIYDFNDEKILHVSSEYFDGGYLNTKNKYPICEILRNPLLQGFYYINVGVVVDGNVVEQLNKCLIFEVINSDFFNTGVILKPSTLKAKALADYKWK
ncbi:MAG: Wzt carbohydrate-binding domain-containing protein, partial [Ignavibacteriae bacterium]|nr:Wzt carbohydrate-binding domain-containing protein [Ignavibacteriota bacterium]